MRDTMTLGEVPISVIVPPSSEPKAIGISRQEGDVPVRRASWKATGISMASAPMFLTKAESSVTAPTSTMTMRGRGEVRAERLQQRPRRCRSARPRR